MKKVIKNLKTNKSTVDKMKMSKSDFLEIVSKQYEDFKGNKNIIALSPESVPDTFTLSEIKISEYKNSIENFPEELKEKRCWSNSCDFLELNFGVTLVFAITNEPIPRGILHFINTKTYGGNKLYFDFTPSKSRFDKVIKLLEFHTIEDEAYDLIGTSIQNNQKFNRVIKKLLLEGKGD